MKNELYDKEFPQNARMMKLCNRAYKYTFITYAFFSGFYLFSSIYFSFFGVYNNIHLLADGVLLKLAYFVFAFWGTYKKHNYYAVAAPACIAFSLLVFPGTEFVHFFLNELFLPVAIAIAVITCIANKKYIWLEQQEGFPYFNERFEKQKSDNIQWNIKNPYEEMAEKRRETASDDMPDVTVTDAVTEKNVDKNNYMDEI